MHALLILLAPPVHAADWPTEAADAPWDRIALGIDVQDVVVGDGLVAESGSRIEVHYTGMLEDGTVFDSSRDRDQTFSIQLGAGQVIPGWDEGLVGLAIGGVRRLVIPPAAGYGDRVAGKIPANSTLYFEVELFSVRAPPGAPAAAPDESLFAVGSLTAVDLVVGSGGKVKLKKGRRACLDHATWDLDDVLVDHTYGRNGCTWYRLDADDLPPEIEAALAGMREGGHRQIRAMDHRTEVRIEALGK